MILVFNTRHPLVGVDDRHLFPQVARTRPLIYQKKIDHNLLN